MSVDSNGLDVDWGRQKCWVWLRESERPGMFRHINVFERSGEVSKVRGFGLSSSTPQSSFERCLGCASGRPRGFRVWWALSC